MHHGTENMKQHTGKKSIKKRNKENHFPKLLFFSGYSPNNALTNIFAACKKVNTLGALESSTLVIFQ